MMRFLESIVAKDANALRTLVGVATLELPLSAFRSENLDDAQKGATGRRGVDVMEGIKHGTLTANGIRIHYVEAGDGPLVSDVPRMAESDLQAPENQPFAGTGKIRDLQGVRGSA